MLGVAFMVLWNYLLYEIISKMSSINENIRGRGKNEPQTQNTLQNFGRKVVFIKLKLLSEINNNTDMS